MQKLSSEEKARRTTLRFDALKSVQQLEASATTWEKLKAKAREENVTDEELGQMFRIYLLFND